MRSKTLFWLSAFAVFGGILGIGILASGRSHKEKRDPKIQVREVQSNQDDDELFLSHTTPNYPLVAS